MNTDKKEINKTFFTNEINILAEYTEGYTSEMAKVVDDVKQKIRAFVESIGTVTDYDGNVVVHVDMF